MSKKKENGYTYCVFDEYAHIQESSILEILKNMSEEDYCDNLAITFEDMTGLYTRL